MKSLIRVSSIFIVLSIAFASETKEEMVGEVQVNNTEAPDKKLLQSGVAPIDIEKINEVRIVKSIRDKRHSMTVLKELKKKDAIKKDFIERQTKKISKDEILKRWSTDIHSKMSVATIKGEDGSAALKLPSAPESN
jgi:hypothetical protein